MREVEFEGRDGRRLRGVVRAESSFGFFILVGEHLYYISKSRNHASYTPVAFL